MKNKLMVLAVGAGFLVGALPSSAHHSFAAEYDQSKTLTLTGKFVRLDFTNPHSWVYFDVTDEATGKVTQWRAEGGPPNIMLRAGWRQNMIKPGETVTLRGNPAKDGDNLMWGANIQLSDGRTVGMSTPPVGKEK
jgi:hypothetical protein